MVNWESCNFPATKENLQFLNLREGGAGSSYWLIHTSRLTEAYPKILFFFCFLSLDWVIQWWDVFIQGMQIPPKSVRICPVQLFMISHSSKEKVSRGVWVRWRVFVGQVTRCGASAGLWWLQPAQALTQWVRPKARPPISWSPRERERAPHTGLT